MAKKLLLGSCINNTAQPCFRNSRIIWKSCVGHKLLSSLWLGSSLQWQLPATPFPLGRVKIGSAYICVSPRPSKIEHTLATACVLTFVDLQPHNSTTYFLLSALVRLKNMLAPLRPLHCHPSPSLVRHLAGNAAETLLWIRGDGTTAHPSPR